jgi:hypothetical protein
MLIACGPVAEDATAVPDSNESNVEDGEEVFPRPTITPVPQEDSSESVIEPEATAVPDDYPPQPTPVVVPEAAYPSAGGEGVWVVFPVGVQCEGDGPFADIDAAVTALDDVGVTVTNQEMVELPVATVCGQPTSEHYRVQILSGDLAEAEDLGWLADSQ